MSSELRPARWRGRLTDVLLLLVLLALSVKLTYHISRVRDIGLGVFDEAAYMASASVIPEVGLPHAAYSPLYALWYHVLSHVKADRVGMYYLNWQILAYLVSASLYLLCRAAGGGRAISLPAALALPGIGNPFEAGRSCVACSQHYAMNVVESTQLPPASVSNFASITAKDFGTAGTLAEAWKANPRALLWHVSYNVRHLPAA